MKESTVAKSRRILNALLEGRKLTAFDANIIGRTTDGGRYIRFIREKYPVKSQRVEGELYKVYWIDEDYLAGLKKPIAQRIKTFFNDLLKGGMFEEANI
jgi:hypothetical protein